MFPASTFVCLALALSLATALPHDIQARSRFNRHEIDLHPGTLLKSLTQRVDALQQQKSHSTMQPYEQLSPQLAVREATPQSAVQQQQAMIAQLNAINTAQAIENRRLNPGAGLGADERKVIWTQAKQFINGKQIV